MSAPDAFRRSPGSCSAARELHRDRGTGAQLAIKASAEYLTGRQQASHPDRSADTHAIAAALYSGAQICAYIQRLAGAEHVRGGRDGLIHSLICTVAGPHQTSSPTPTSAIPAATAR